MEETVGDATVDLGLRQAEGDELAGATAPPCFAARTAMTRLGAS